MFSFSNVVASECSLSTYSGKKLGSANHKLILLTLQHHSSLAGSQCCPALNRIRLTLESNLLPWIEPTESQVIRLRINFFHSFS
jgi:hypothetical protein